MTTCLSMLFAEAVRSGLAVCSDDAKIFPTVRVVPAEDDGSSWGIVEIGAHAIVRDGVVIASGVRVGQRTVIGNNVVLRARAKIGNDVVISHGATIERNTTIGDNVRISAQTHLTGGCVVEDGVQIGARVVTINDKEMRWRSSPVLAAQIFRRNCKIGSGVTLMAGVEIGESTFVGAGSLVTKSLPPGVLAFGVPAYIQRDV